MAKMFYTTDEAAQKLGITAEQLKGLVSSNKLREFRDGARVMFKVDQVDKLASDKGASKAGDIGLSDSGIALAPNKDSHASDVISLSDTSAPPAAKDDTVVTGQGDTKPGVNVLGSDAKADSQAQTRIQSAIDDQLSLEGVGSGSGLLDLTRESDDTSLGAELLDEIYPGGEGKGDSSIASASGIFSGDSAVGASSAGDSSGPSGLENIAAAPAVVAPAELIDAADPASGAFGGMAIASVVIMVASLVIGVSFMSGFTPGWLQAIISSGTNLMIFTAALVIVTILLTFFGFFAGKATSR